MTFDPDAYLAGQTQGASQPEKKTITEPQKQPGGFDPDAYLAKGSERQKDQESTEERPWYAFDIKNIPAAIQQDLEVLDNYTGRPIRNFVTSMATGEDVPITETPTGSEQAKMMGASDMSYKEAFGVPSWLGGDVAPADIYGLALEMIQDPLVVAAAMKRGLKGMKILADNPTVRSTLGMAQESKAASKATSTAKNTAKVEGGGLTVENSGQVFDYKAPKSLDELREWKPGMTDGNQVGKQRLKEIEEVVPDLQTRPLNYHYEMMENPKSMKEMKLEFENLPTDDAKKIAAYNQNMVDESVSKIKSTVDEYAGAPPRGVSDAGDDFIKTVKDKYGAEKSELGPMFNKIKENATDLNSSQSQELIAVLGDETRLGKLLDIDGESGRFFLKKNTPRSGLSDPEHKLLSRVVDDLNDGMTFKEIQETREFLRKAVDPKNPGATAEINKVRTVLLRKLEDMAQGMGDDVGETFTRYAKNERARESLEKVIGGKIESLDQLYAANPDKVINKIFSNPNYADIAKEYVGEEKFTEMVSSYLKQGIDKASDSAKGFSPEKFRTWMGNSQNRKFLEKHVDPDTVRRLDALADYGYYSKRFLDEVNPSGTAASLKAMIEPKNFTQRVSQQGFRGALTSELATRVNARSTQKQAVKKVDEALGNKPKKKPKKDWRLKDKAGKALDTSARARRGAIGSNAYLRDVTNSAKSAENEKKKGPEKWANDGLEKLLKKNPDKIGPIKGALLKSKKGKKLLIAASSAKPDSKTMDRILGQIEKEFGGAK